MSSTLDQVRDRIQARRSLPSPPARKALREAVGSSLRDVADVVGVTPSAVHLWESGANDPRGENLTRYAELLRVFRELA